MKKPLSKEEQRVYLYSKIGEPVNFKYPEPPYLLKGKLLDRYAISDYGDDWVDYWSMIDLIRFEGEDEDWLRITYYRYKKKESRWVFAGQTSLAIPISGFLELFVKAIKEKEWIRPLFREVYKRCFKELNVEKL
jgi:hypothetical protein